VLEDFFQSKGRNISNGVILIEQNYSIKATILEFISEQVERAKGVIKGSAQLVLDKKLKVQNFL
jgi:hypothetical protein